MSVGTGAGQCCDVTPDSYLEPAFQVALATRKRIFSVVHGLPQVNMQAEGCAGGGVTKDAAGTMLWVLEAA